MYTARCNASCGHCSTSCGPRRTELLPRGRLFAVMARAAAVVDGEPLKFGITGGEPFLDFDLLHAIVAHGKSLGATIACVTNAYWATSPTRARALLTDLKQAGLDAISISSSRFHERFVPRRRVDLALRIAREAGLSATLKFVQTHADTETVGAVAARARAAGAAHVEVFPLLPHLSAGASLPDGEYLREPGVPAGACPAPLLTIDWNGAAWTCCTPGAFNEFYALGSDADANFAAVRERFYLGGKQQILREHGPRYFAERIRERGLGHRLRPAYGGVCDLCTHIASDPELARIASECAGDFEARQLQNVLDRLVDRTPAPATAGNP